MDRIMNTFSDNESQFEISYVHRHLMEREAKGGLGKQTYKTMNKIKWKINNNKK